MATEYLMQPSRRAFLFGRGKTPATPWLQFCQRLARTCQGRVDEAGGALRLTPTGTADVLHARALCAQYGVRLGLAGTACAPSDDGPMLWLDPGAQSRLTPLADTPGLWRAETGVLVRDLRAVGLTQFADAPADMTLAVWLACQASALCATGRTADAGVLGVDVILADGTCTALGPFGERDLQPLRGATMQRLVPRLFELASGDDAQLCLAQPCWPARARLDALRPQEGSVNLAHLLLGHAGSLAWVEAVVLGATHLDVGWVERSETQRSTHRALGFAFGSTQPTAARLDAAVKSLFDPGGLFLDCLS